MDYYNTNVIYIYIYLYKSWIIALLILNLYNFELQVGAYLGPWKHLTWSSLRN